MERVWKFFTLRENWDALPEDTRRRVPYLVITTLVLVVFFSLTGTLRYREDPDLNRWFALGLSLTSPGFLISLGLMRSGRYEAASVLSSVVLFLNLQWMGFLLPPQNPLEVYRYLSYTFASIIVVNLMSFRTWVLIFYGVGATLGVLALVFLRYLPTFLDASRETFSLMGYSIILLLTITLVLIQTSKYTLSLVALSRDEEKRSHERFLRLNALMEESKKTFGIGTLIEEVSRKSLEEGRKTEESARQIQLLMEELARDSSLSSRAFGSILQQTRAMMDGLESSHQAINTTSSGVTEIMTTISGLADSADAKRSGLQGLLSSVESRKADIQELRSSILAAVASSRQFESIISTISDISEQTSLLAMNASIEAAHAGTAGRGFSVIAGQVKKLSETARISSGQISKILAGNISSMETGASLVESTSAYFTVLSAQVRDTVESMDELLLGLKEISSGTAGIHGAAGILLEQSSGNSDQVGKVEKITRDTGDLVDRLARASTRTMESLLEMRANLGSINSGLTELAQAGRTNVAALNDLEKRIGEITGS